MHGIIILIFQMKSLATSSGLPPACDFTVPGYPAETQALNIACRYNEIFVILSGQLNAFFSHEVISLTRVNGNAQQRIGSRPHD
jgi:hypothetical protein